ncbi:YecA family protein [Lysobacteraceae bacterium NML120232]|nr:YecA family protein [Xanthomonadaceae bacterium NML120232]
MSNLSALPDWQAIESVLAPLQLAVSPAELHGALTGWLAGGGEAGGAWLGKVLADDDLPQPDAADLQALHDATVAALEDGEFGFQLLLPDEDAPLAVRGNALFDWCRAFLGGFGLAAGAEPALGEDGNEALEDLARLAMAEADSEGDEEDERAFAELEEFVRVAALLLHGDCALAARQRKKLH